MTILILLALCAFLFYRIQVWKDRRDTAVYDLEIVTTAKAELQKEYDFVKESIASWNTKPVYALLSDQQITRIAELVAESTKEPKWLN